MSMQIFEGRAFHAEGTASAEAPREDSALCAGGGQFLRTLALTRREVGALESPTPGSGADLGPLWLMC